MLTAQAYLELVRNRSERNLTLERVFHNLQNPDLFLKAYGKLYANKGTMTTGAEPTDSIDGMSITRIEKIIQNLNDGTFRWQPAKRIYIPKKNGKMRPLGLPSWTDKLVQEVMRLIMEAYYELRFSTHSHGFRANRGCHTALEEILRHSRGTTWFIEGDIKGCFDNIDHDILLEIIGRNIKDPKFLKLLREMLKAGDLEDWKYQNTYSGTPQGGVISPLLANIYLNELDRYVETAILPQYNKGRKKPINPEYKEIENRIHQARRKGQTELAEELGKKLRTIKSRLTTPDYRRLMYVRYADDFILCFTGTKAEAMAIKEQIRQFLATIKLTMSEEKTLITHTASEPARFLGYNLQVEWVDSQRINQQRHINGRVMLRVPEDVQTTWKQKYQGKGKPAHNAKLLADSDFDIITRYNSELTGLTNYYQMAINVSGLHEVRWIMEQSLIKTLASKHQQSCNWVYRKHRTKSPEGLVCIETRIEREGKKPLIARFGGLPIRYKRFSTSEDNRPQLPKISNRTQLEQRLLANECELCGSKEKVEVHHIKSIKALIQKHRKRGTEMPWWVKHMAEAYRKTIVVCDQCHTQIHSGSYDGRKLN